MDQPFIKSQRFIVFVGDESHPPLERVSYRQWRRIERWLFEHCYIDVPMATMEKYQYGKWHAVVRERFTSSGRERVVISQNRRWQYDLDRRAGLIFIRWNG